MSWAIGVVGASGYAGGELLRLVLQHPELELIEAAAGTQAGELITDVHPGLADLAGREFTPTDAAALAELDLVFVALPHGTSAALTAKLPDNVRVVDLGADHRLTHGSQWDKYYGGGPAAQPWTYGLPELPGRRSQIVEASRVASPGCYATAIELALAPLLAGRLVQASDIVIVAASGTSGAGRKATIALSATEVMGSMSAYKVGGSHQHTAEIEQELTIAAGTAVTVSFTPMLAPMPRGILASCTAVARPGVGQSDLSHTLHTAYSAETFVQLLPEGRLPTTAATAGTNAAHLQIAFDEHSGRVVVISALDNLIKGAAGQAMQNANLMLGLPEASGLTVNAVAP